MPTKKNTNEEQMPGEDAPAKPSIERVKTATGKLPRWPVIDRLRGLVMALMVLDHSLFYFTDPAIAPCDLVSNPFASLFWMEWVTHFCAPTFFLLAGVSAYLQTSRGMSKQDLSKYLLSRGLILIVLDFTVVQWCLFFCVDFSVFSPLVLWMLGASMIVLAGLIWLPTAGIGVFGVTMILFHNLLYLVKPDDLGIPNWLWTLLHQENGGFLSPPSGRPVVFVNFKLIPWVGVMATGYALGALLMCESKTRRKILWRLGGVMTLSFLVLRYFNLYGDPQPWPYPAEVIGDNRLWNVMSFLNTEKYPASLQFLLMTLGPVFLLWGCLDWEPAEEGKPKVGDRLLRPFQQFGRVPLFFYIGQWFMLHFLAVILAWCEGRPTDWLFATFDLKIAEVDIDHPKTIRVLNWDPNADIGWTGAIYATVIAVLLLYPACVWYGRLKQRYPKSWLRLF